MGGYQEKLSNTASPTHQVTRGRDPAEFFIRRLSHSGVLCPYYYRHELKVLKMPLEKKIIR